jgi:TetR/AcrR family transcriptional regulator, mexJK operon transcriptional repressor
MSTASPSLGRPKDPAKRAAILQAAEAMFFEHGFGGATLEAVAERAGVSKVTLYGHFGDRGGLFEAVIETIAERMERAMATEIGGDAPLDQRLVAFGIALMGEIMTDRMIAFERHLADGLVAHPELARRCYDAGPGWSHGRLVAMLRDAMAAGTIERSDPVLAADDLFGLWHGFTAAQTKFGVAIAPTPAEVDARVRRGVARFLKAYRAEV